MGSVLLIVAAVAVVCIALVAVGRVTLTLAEQPRRSYYDIDEAVEFVGDELPEHVTAELSYDDVRALLRWHLDYLEAKGVAFGPGEEPDEDAAQARQPQPEGVDVEPVDPERGPLVADDDEALAYLLGKVAESDLDIDDVAVVEVLVAERRYLEAIGAIGRQVPAPGDQPDQPDGPDGPDPADRESDRESDRPGDRPADQPGAP
jgi:hypothetical protein